MTISKGIILAGGTGSRLYPLNLATNKQLVPIYDKPVIYYPLTTLLLSGINDILIISTPSHTSALQNLLQDGKKFGVSIKYEIQTKPTGLPDAFVIAENFINSSPVTLILGDNFFHGQGLSSLLISNHTIFKKGAQIYTYNVDDPSRYGVAEIINEKITRVIEKPKEFISDLAITGLYSFDGTVSKRAKELSPSIRGETEIVELIRTYIEEDSATNISLGRGYVWFDVGTPDSLLSAANYVQVIQNRQGVCIASPEEVAWRMKLISDSQYEQLISELPNCNYKKMLLKSLKH